jgi:uncharacterized protein YjdB
MKVRLRWTCCIALAMLGIEMACSSSQQPVAPVGPVHSILVTPDSAAVNVHGTQTFSATAHDAAGAIDSSATFHWSSSDTTIATIDQNGHATAVDTGHVRIAASTQGISGFANLTVQPAPIGSVIVVPASDTLAIGAKVQLSDTVKDMNGTVRNVPVTWASSNTGVAVVSSTGQVTGGSSGTATITAAAGGKTGSNTTVVVDTTAPASISLQINPDSVVAIPNPLDVLVQVTATVTTVSGRVLNNYPVVFTSTNPPVSGFLGAGPDTVIGGSILIAPDANGRAVITATAGSASTQSTLTVCYVASTPICNPFARIQVTPPADTLTVGDSVHMEAIGIDSSGNMYPNMFVEWDAGQVVSSDSSRVIVVDPEGEVHALNPGTQQVDASIQGFGAEADITVTAAPAAAIAAAPGYEEQRARVIAKAQRARRQALDARNRRHQQMRQLLVSAMRGVKNPTTLKYYRRVLARIDAETMTPGRGATAR